MPVADVIAAVTDHVSRAKGYDLYRDYEEGRHQYPYASTSFQSTFGWILKAARANLCPTVVSNFTDRVEVEGWDGAGAEQAVEAARVHGLDKILNLAFREAWRAGDGYVLVWPNTAGQLVARFHRADQVAFQASEDDPDTFDWVAKLWVGGDHHGRVSMYYPDRLERWATVSRVRDDAKSPVTWPEEESAYGPVNDEDGDTVTYKSAGIEGMPWVHFPFDATSQGGHGRSILRDVIPLQDGLNHALHSVLVNVEDYAEPLRALLGYKASKELDPATGRQRDVEFKMDPTVKKMYAFEGDNNQLVQMNPPDSGNILKVMESFGAWIARTVGIPVSDVVPDLGNVPSGTSLRVLATRRTAAVKDFTSGVGPALARLMALLGVPDAYPNFVDPAPTDEAERWETSEVRDRLGFPLGENLREMGWEQDDIDRVHDALGDEEAAVGRAARLAYEQGRT